MSVQTLFVVKGMTCQHCVSSVTEEISQIARVRGVDVDLASGRVVVSSDVALDVAEVSSAIDEAGYELVENG